jgi:branched-subunit amino acid transport protein
MQLFLVIVAMGIVTFLPRVLPVLIMDKWALPTWMKRWLKAVPYAALGALIFPGILFVDPDRPWVGLVGGMVAFALAMLRLPLLAVILGAIITVILVNGI